MRNSGQHVWYAAYGSNLHWPRFRCYLQGGRAPGAARVHRPCTDRRAPRADVAATLPFPLLFAGASPTWGGGSAFIDPGRRDAATRARLYLVTIDQFATVVAAEGHRTRVRLPSRAAATPPWYRVAPGSYGIVVECGQRDGLPVLSVTSTAPGAQPAPPRPGYLRTVAEGLREAHGLSPAAVADYLAPVPGVAGHYGHAALVVAAAARQRPPDA